MYFVSEDLYFASEDFTLEELMYFLCLRICTLSLRIYLWRS